MEGSVGEEEHSGMPSPSFFWGGVGRVGGVVLGFFFSFSSRNIFFVCLFTSGALRCM